MLTISIASITFGICLYVMGDMFPQLQKMQYISLCLLVLPWILTLYRIYITRTWYHVNKLPIWKHLINYMRRDNEIIPIVGNRAFPGESFIDVPKLGLIEFLGKDCVYTWGDKKVLWGLENVNFTPDARYSNLCGVMFQLGMQNTNDMLDVFNGRNLELMGNVYLKMLQNNKRGADKLIEEFKTYEGKYIDFKKEMRNNGGIHEKVDRLLSRSKVVT